MPLYMRRCNTSAAQTRYSLFWLDDVGFSVYTSLKLLAPAAYGSSITLVELSALRSVPVLTVTDARAVLASLPVTASTLLLV